MYESNQVSLISTPHKYTIEIFFEHDGLFLNYFSVNEFILRWIFIFAIN